MNRHQEYYLKNKEKETARKKLYYKNNKEKVINFCKKWQEKNKEKVINYNKKRYQENKSHILECCKKYRESNKDSIRKKYIAKYANDEYKINHKNYIKNKYHTDPVYKIISLHRTRLRSALKSQNVIKLAKSVELFGCNPIELKCHLEKQFKPEWNWENHGSVWQIDHIKPLSRFDLKDEMQQRKAFHYSNLQPMLKEDNLRKYNHLNWKG